MSRRPDRRTLFVGVVGLAVAATVLGTLVATHRDRERATRPAFRSARDAALSACAAAASSYRDVLADAPAPAVLRDARDARAAADVAVRLDTRYLQLASAAQSLEASLKADDPSLARTAIRLLDTTCRPLGVPLLEAP